MVYFFWQQRLFVFYYLLILFIPYSSVQATTVNISVAGSDQPVTAVTGQSIQFDVSVTCAGGLGYLSYVEGTAQSKDNKSKSEIEWSFINNSPETIRLTGFGVTWRCISGECNDWFFDYLKFDKPVNGAKKIYKDKSPVSSPFSVTDFDSNVGDSKEYKHPYLDITAGSKVKVDEIEFVTFKGKKKDKKEGKKIEHISSGTKLELSVIWRDINGNTYPQNFTVTWP